MHPLFEKVCVVKHPEFLQLNHLLPAPPWPPHLQKCLCARLAPSVPSPPELDPGWSRGGVSVLHAGGERYGAI